MDFTYLTKFEHLSRVFLTGFYRYRDQKSIKLNSNFFRNILRKETKNQQNK